MAGSNFVDYVKIFARSGHGGAGSKHFRREKFVAFGGPDGGDGGKGGSIILQGDRQYWTLIHLKYQRHQFAEDGESGSGARSHGKDAKDIILPVPLGTVARNAETGEVVGEVAVNTQYLHNLRVAVLGNGTIIVSVDNADFIALGVAEVNFVSIAAINCAQPVIFTEISVKNYLAN